MVLQLVTAHKFRILIVIFYPEVCLSPQYHPRFTSKPKYSAFSQQQTMLLARGIPNPDPCAQFGVKDLDKFLTTIKSSDDKILLV
jgi:hypothetical protein